MPRIRTVKPEFWVDEKVVELGPWARLLFIGLWNFADDQGYVDYSPKRIRMQVFPGDSIDVESLIGELCASGLTRAYESPVGPVLHVVNWTRHQRIDKPGKPRFAADDLRPFPTVPVPVPDRSPTTPGTFPESSTNVPRIVDQAVTSDSWSPREGSWSPREDSCAERKGREGKGREVPPTAGALTLAAPDTTQALVGEWIEHCPNRPPGPVIGQVSKLIKNMLGENIAPQHVRRGLAEWARKGLHPSTLPSVVNEVMNAGAGSQVRKPSTADQRVGEALTLAARFAQEEAS